MHQSPVTVRVEHCRLACDTVSSSLSLCYCLNSYYYYLLRS